MGRMIAGASLAGLLLAGAALAQQGEAPKPNVVVSAVAERDVTPSFHYVGRVEAMDRVELRARVEGYLEQRNFREGERVRNGDLLFVLEKAPYEIVVEQRQADLAGAQATLKEARAEFKRKQELVDRSVLSDAELDTARADEATAEATVLQAEAALRQARLDLSYTDVTSPMEGRIGTARYSVGNLVGPGSEPLATVIRLDPIYVSIAVSEKDLIEVRRQGIDLQNPPVAPHLTLSDGSTYDHDGEFDYLGNEVSPSTDTVTARATFPNPDGVLLPGQFVEVVVRQKTPQTALVVPQAAVQEDQEGYFVLVVNREGKVQVKRVEVGDQLATDWVIASGLSQGEQVITQGVQKVRPDMLVETTVAEAQP